MTREQELYLLLLSDYVHQRKSEIRENDTDFQRLAEVARRQNTVGILWYQLKDAPLPEIAAREFKEGFLSDAYLSVNSSYALNEIGRCFSEQKIPYLPFKG